MLYFVYFQGSSVECGLNTGCVKIFIDSEERLMRKQREYGFEFSGQGWWSKRWDIGCVNLSSWLYQANHAT